MVSQADFLSDSPTERHEEKDSFSDFFKLTKASGVGGDAHEPVSVRNQITFTQLF